MDLPCLLTYTSSCGARHVNDHNGAHLSGARKRVTLVAKISRSPSNLGAQWAIHAVSGPAQTGAPSRWVPGDIENRIPGTETRSGHMPREAAQHDASITPGMCSVPSTLASIHTRKHASKKPAPVPIRNGMRPAGEPRCSEAASVCWGTS